MTKQLLMEKKMSKFIEFADYPIAVERTPNQTINDIKIIDCFDIEVGSLINPDAEAPFWYKVLYNKDNVLVLKNRLLGVFVIKMTDFDYRRDRASNLSNLCKRRWRMSFSGKSLFNMLFNEILCNRISSYSRYPRISTKKHRRYNKSSNLRFLSKKTENIPIKIYHNEY